jgi:hypothetical protein
MTYASIALTTPLMHAAAVARVSVAVPMTHAAPTAHAAPNGRVVSAPSAAPIPFMSPAPSPFITMRVPALPLHPHRRARLAVPMFGFAAVLLLALAYALKPATIVPETASIATPAMAEPLAMSAAGVVAETAPAELAPAEPAAVAIAKPASALVGHNARLERTFDAKPAPRAAQKPRAFAKRRPIKIDASITSSPLGQLRPSRR